ncbi:CD9 antigen-like [Tropilaelaps mercedesae]|uniref:CD9 antigen-like n=1 Tax=Tropilaelaps mercedesae TaxID=418985 RepID=A0A1V9Y0W5_9ACAR|nr:CD9 antigen-like [Tropilaelaps mercedesae]
MMVEIKKRLLSMKTDSNARRFMNLLQIHLGFCVIRHGHATGTLSDLPAFQMECCGSVSKNDYTENYIAIPQSCSNSRTNNIYIYGCSENLRVHLQRTGATLGGLAMALLFAQIISVCVNFLLLVNLRDEYGPKIY